MKPEILEKFAKSLVSENELRERFVTILSEGVNPSSALVWLAEAGQEFETLPPLHWQPDFVQRVARHEKPGKHPLHEAGAYYCLDSSSVFMASVLSVVPKSPGLALDMCASPGGKAVFLWRLLKPGFLYCNETIKKRSAALISNLKRCKVKPAAVSTLDSSFFANRYPDSMQLVVVDAPCSGQALSARTGLQSGVFHHSLINKNSNRQKRILANAAKTVAAGGYVAYMTCTYSREENEEVLEWFLAKFPEFSALDVPLLASLRSHLSEQPAYRLWPDAESGGGGFACIMRRQGEPSAAQPDIPDIPWVWSTLQSDRPSRDTTSSPRRAGKRAWGSR